MTIAAPIPDGMRAAQARVASLRSLLGLRDGTSGTAFASVLAAQSSESVAAASSIGNAATGADVVAAAKAQLGVPYVWGGADPKTGFDCSGLVQYAYGQLGIDVPRNTVDQAQAGAAVASLADAKPGDLVAFGTPPDHIGIYAGDNTMIVAPHRGDVVRTQTITETPTAIRRILPSVGGQYGDLFAAAGARYNVSPALLASVAKTESNFDPNAVSKAGAQGLMQLMPSTAQSLGVNPLDPAQAVDGAARLLRSLLDSFGGDTKLAVAAYNAGSAAVKRYGGVPPYAETQNYVRRVLAGMQEGSPWN
jgi:peptidoglycan DL-endopeptidase CwlO